MPLSLGLLPHQATEFWLAITTTTDIRVFISFLFLSRIVSFKVFSYWHSLNPRFGRILPALRSLESSLGKLWFILIDKRDWNRLIGAVSSRLFQCPSQRNRSIADELYTTSSATYLEKYASLLIQFTGIYPL